MLFRTRNSHLLVIAESHWAGMHTLRLTDCTVYCKKMRPLQRGSKAWLLTQLGLFRGRIPSTKLSMMRKELNCLTCERGNCLKHTRLAKHEQNCEASPKSKRVQLGWEGGPGSVYIWEPGIGVHVGDRDRAGATAWAGFF